MGEGFTESSGSHPVTAGVQEKAAELIHNVRRNFTSFRIFLQPEGVVAAATAKKISCLLTHIHEYWFIEQYCAFLY